MIDVEAVAAKFHTDIARLDRMAANLLTMNEIEFVYDQLQRIVPEDGMTPSGVTLDFILKNQALTTALVIAYGRLFARTTNTTQLDARKIPEYLRKAHDQILDLRNERYAHHGAHSSISSTASIMLEGEKIVFSQALSIGMWLGAPSHWGPLFSWLREHIFQRVQGEMAYLSRQSGVTWKLREGPAPPWADKGE